MSLKQLAINIESTRIKNIEEIASKIRGINQEEYSNMFALEIAKQKIENYGNDTIQNPSGIFPYTLFQGEESVAVKNIVCLSAGH